LGIVRRQGLRNTIISYLGLGLGFVNTTFLLPRFLEPGQLGLTQVLVSIATIYAQLSAFGFASAGIRFFPYFRDAERRHHGFLPLLLGVPLLGFGVMTALFFLGKPLLLSLYTESSEIAAYYPWIAVLALFTLLYSLQDAYLKGLYHTAFSSFLQEVLLRVLIAGVALLFGLGYLTFPQFVLAYLGVNSGLTLLLTAYLAYIGELHLRPTRAVLQVRPVRELLGFGAFALLSNISGTVITTIDALMLGSKESLAAAGIYAIASNISIALVIPSRALNKIAFPLLADYWKDEDLPRMATFYRNTTRLLTVLGCWLALGIGLNLDFIYHLIHKPAYAAGTIAVLLLLAGRLFDSITGLNGLIVVTSPRYRYDLIFNASLAMATIGLNLLLIPRFGLTGAALAALLSLASINLARTWFVWHSYRMQPFTWSIAGVLAVAAVAGVAAWLVPFVHSYLVTMLVRSVVLTGLYGGLLLILGLVPEASPWLRKLRGTLPR